MWKLYFVTYSGMTIPMTEGSYADCRARAQARKKWYEKKMGGTVSFLGGKTWECVPSDDALMISDFDGYMKIRKAG